MQTCRRELLDRTLRSADDTASEAPAVLEADYHWQ